LHAEYNGRHAATITYRCRADQHTQTIAAIPAGKRLANKKDQDAIARVVVNHSSELTLSTSSGDTIIATPKMKLGLVVTGDLVRWHAEDHGNARVTEVMPRTGTLARTDRQGNAKPIATNISQVLVVTAPKPPFDTLLLDRYCVAACNIGAEIAVIINKTDLLDEATTDQAQQIESLYGSLGYRVARCCTKKIDGMEEIKSLLDNQISILVGQSGVGKSSILNALLPQHNTKTGGLSDNSGLGRHTTTVTNWYDLPNEGAIIDSPGAIFKPVSGRFPILPRAVSSMTAHINTSRTARYSLHLKAEK